MNKYSQVFISAENRKQADTILNSLLEKKLVSGGMILNAPARFWWKEEIVDIDYVNISTFTHAQNKQAIIDDVKITSVEEVPMIWFTDIEGNGELLQWIDENVR